MEERFDRNRNHVFSSYPWLVKSFDQTPDVMSAVVEKLRKVIDASETLDTHNSDNHFIRGKLGLSFDPTRAGTGVAREYAFAHFILRYRLLDVVLWVSRDGPPGETSIQRTPFPDTQNFPQFKRLGNWPGLVREAYNWFSTSSATATIVPPTSTSICMKHLHSFILHSKSRAFDRIYLNIDLAALYLSHLIEGHHDLDKSNAPKELFTVLDDQGLNLNGIKTPLHLALSVSPLCLLLTVNLGRGIYGRPKMLQLLTALGSERPRHVRIAEVELWNALIDVSISASVNTRDRFTVAFKLILDKMEEPGLTVLGREDLLYFVDGLSNQAIGTMSGGKPTQPDMRQPDVAFREEEEEENLEGSLMQVGTYHAGQISQVSTNPGPPNHTPHPTPPPNISQTPPLDDDTASSSDTSTRTRAKAIDLGFPNDNKSPGAGRERTDIGDSSSMPIGNSPIIPLTRNTPSNSEIDAAIPTETNKAALVSTSASHGGNSPMNTDGTTPAIIPPLNVVTSVTSTDQGEAGANTSVTPEHTVTRRLRAQPKPAVGQRKSARTSRTRQEKLFKYPKVTTRSRKYRRVEKVTEEKEHPTLVLKLEKNVAIEVIDLTQDEVPHPKTTLLSTETKQRVTATTTTRLYGCGEYYIDYTPSFHHKEHLEWYEKVIAGVQQSYYEGLPLHIVKPEDSIIKILDFATFNSLSHEALQEIFRTQHIVVTDYPYTSAHFDEEAMGFLANSSKPITIQDMSILPDSGDGNERHVIGTTADLLKSHRSNTGKILNALDFPMPIRGCRPPESIATDRLAFNETFDDPQCSRKGPFPDPDMYWGLAATSHAFHMFHIDADGFGTFVAPQTGSKYWVLARPKPGTTREFSKTTLYVDNNYEIDEMNLDIWDTEAILLTPRSCLFMQPNTPHLVLTPKAAICHGGHFYATSTIRQTCHGILHTFVLNSILTNTEHTNASRDLLRRLLAYYWKSFRMDYVDDSGTQKMMNVKYKGRIPDIFTFDGLLDVYSLCILMELGNVVHHKSYMEGGLSTLERQKMIEGRSIARHVRKWLTYMVELHDPNQDMTLLDLDKGLFYPYYRSQVSALLHYKQRAEASGVQSNNHFTLKELKHQINRAISLDTLFLEEYDRSADPGTFDWSGPELRVLPTRVGGYWPSGKPNGENPDDKIWKNKRHTEWMNMLLGESNQHSGDKELRMSPENHSEKTPQPSKRKLDFNPPNTRKKTRT